MSNLPLEVLIQSQSKLIQDALHHHTFRREESAKDS